jgi:hypothetical protein
MKLAMGTVFLFLAASCIYLATHGLEAASPWGAFQTITSKIQEAEGS